jgi:uncharacterized coiled-coil protein SlyX
MSGEFLHFSFTIFTTGPDNFFCKSYSACTLAGFATGGPRRRPGVLPLSRKFCFASAFLHCRACSNQLFILQVLALLEKQHEKRVAESAQVVKIVELEVVARSQADRIAELEVTCTDFKCEKDKVTDGYQRLAEKHKSLAEKAEHDKTKLVEAHAVEITKLHADLDLETRSYTEYRQNVHCQLHRLHKAVASSFKEVKAQCLPFPNKGVKVEEMIDRVVMEVKAVLDTIW